MSSSSLGLLFSECVLCRSSLPALHGVPNFLAVVRDRRWFTVLGSDPVSLVVAARRPGPDDRHRPPFAAPLSPVLAVLFGDFVSSVTAFLDACCYELGIITLHWQSPVRRKSVIWGNPDTRLDRWCLSALTDSSRVPGIGH